MGRLAISACAGVVIGQSRVLRSIQNKTRMKLFSPKTRNETRKKLQDLSQKQQERISYEEIKSCITDRLLLQIFDNPDQLCEKETNTVRLIRTLGKLCKPPIKVLSYS
jgi:hypothetical protein